MHEAGCIRPAGARDMGIFRQDVSMLRLRLPVVCRCPALRAGPDACRSSTFGEAQ